jgi:aquaporin Z
MPCESGCQLRVLIAGRMSVADFISYVIAQVLGAIAGAAVLYLILSGKASGWSGGLGQNGWGAGYLGQYNVASAFVFEAVATFLFLVCILGATHGKAPVHFAGLAIGLTLTAIHIVGINVTGVSVNPARSIGPALIGAGTNPAALGQIWLFIVAPLLGAGVAGLLFKSGMLEPDNSPKRPVPESLKPVALAGVLPRERFSAGSRFSSRDRRTGFARRE